MSRVKVPVSIAALHKSCGAVAFYYDHLPEPDEQPESRRATSVTGGSIPTSSIMRCGYCGYIMTPREVRFVDLSTIT